MISDADLEDTVYRHECLMFSFMNHLTDLLPLSDSFVNKLRERLSMDEFAMSWGHRQLPFLIDHFASGDGDNRDAVALHALEDVVVHSLVVGLG